MDRVDLGVFGYWRGIWLSGVGVCEINLSLCEDVGGLPFGRWIVTGERGLVGIGATRLILYGYDFCVV